MSDVSGSEERGTQRRGALRRWGSLILAFAAVAGLAAYLWLERDQLLSIRFEDPGYLSLCVLGMLVNVSANALVYLLVFGKLGARVSFGESFSLITLSIAANLFLPLRGGAGLRAVYLKRVHKLRYSRFAASLIIFYVLSAIVASLGALLAALWLATVEGRPGLAPIVIVAVVCLLGGAATLYLPRLKWQGSWFADALAGISDGWHTLRASPGLLARLLPATALQTIGLLLSLWGAAAAIGIRLSAVEILLVGTLGVLSTLISLTPGSLGIYEATVGLAATTVGMGATEGVVAALVSRTVLMVLLAVIAPLATLSLFRRQDSLRSGH